MSGEHMGAHGPYPIVLALGADPREQALLAAIERWPGRVRVVRRCLDLADLLAAAQTGSCGAAAMVVLSPALARLDQAAVARLVSAGLRVMALVERSDQASAARLLALGVQQVLHVADTCGGEPALGTGPELLEDLVRALSSTPTDRAGDPPPALPVVPGQAHQACRDEPPEAGAATGRLVAVWGPTGAPGRTTVAVTLADELARLQLETVLADADTYGPALGQTLAVLDEASGLAAAARAANAGHLDVDTLAGCARLVRPGLRLLTGVTRPDRWPELPASALATVWATARTLALWTVVDCGFCLEQDEEIAYDTYAPRRNGATLATLRAADLVVAVGGADPVSLQRLIRLLPELRATAPQAEVRVVINQVRPGPVGRHPERRLLDSLARYAGVATAVLVPADRDALDSALASGRTLAESAPSSPARSAVRALAATLVATGAG